MFGEFVQIGEAESVVCVQKTGNATADYLDHIDESQGGSVDSCRTSQCGVATLWVQNCMLRFSIGFLYNEKAGGIQDELRAQGDACGGTMIASAGGRLGRCRPTATVPSEALPAR